MNLSRVIGPVLAGALLGGRRQRLRCSCSTRCWPAIGASSLILRWKHQPKASALPGERFVGAMRVGLSYALQSPRLKIVLLRVFLFFLQSTALIALLPLVARACMAAAPGTFTRAAGVPGRGRDRRGAALSALAPRYRRDQFVRGGTLLQAATAVLVVYVPELWLALPAMALVGMAWISVANSLTMSAQVALPDWVRARGMSIYQMALMGGTAAGSLLWGQVAELDQRAPASVAAASVVGVLVLLLTRRLTVEGGADPDFSPAPVASAARAGARGRARRRPGDGDGRVPDRPGARRRVRRGHAAHAPRAAAPGRAVVGAVPRRGGARALLEYFVDENWVEHQRRLERFTAFEPGCASSGWPSTRATNRRA